MATFADLERPIGRLDPAILEPLDRYFATLVHRAAYALLGYRLWPMVEVIRAAALVVCDCDVDSPLGIRARRN